jgi:hypothetical protein
MDIESSILIALIAGIVAILTTVLTNRTMRRKNNADAAEALSIAVTNLITPLNNRIIDLERDEARIRLHLSKVLAGVKRLIEQIRQQGCTPVWTPEDVAVDLAAEAAERLASMK